jgi:hypothetical protein
MPPARVRGAPIRHDGDAAMTHLSAFDGPLGFVTLHPLFTLGPVLFASLVVALVIRRRQTPPRRRA